MDDEKQVVELLESLFGTLDREDFLAVAGLLTEDAELCDELTGRWMRGRAEVSAYLTGQSGVVTAVRSELTSVAASRLASGVGLATFAVRQTYRVSGDLRREDLLGAALFDLSDVEAPQLRHLHLGPIRPSRAP